MNEASPAPVLALEKVSYVYQPSGVRALDQVTLELGAGQRIALIGQNGSGKSTLVRHLNGLLRPTTGRVLLNGDETTRRTVAVLAHVVGLVFQDPDRQIFAGSVQAEVEFGPRNLGMRGSRLHAAVDGALAATGLADVLRANPYDLGGSRRKLLALASVLAMETPVLVLDEPTTGQDMAGVDVVRAVIQSAARAGRTVITISHDMEFVAAEFERVVVMGAGRVLADGSPAEVFARKNWPVLESTYLEPPLAARIGERMRLGATPTPDALSQALVSAQ